MQIQIKLFRQQLDCKIIQMLRMEEIKWSWLLLTVTKFHKV